jgi:tRNA pseudouridine38-40 synthase
VARTLKLLIAYDGTGLAGWQRQATEPTVQASIEDALTPIEGSTVVITGAGRTDAGVHAAGQVASVSLQSSISVADLRRALNATLPEAIRILDVTEVRTDFNARFDARSKTYRYCIYCGDVMPPALRRYAWHVPQRLGVDRMCAAAAMLVGTHDFMGFQATGSDVKSTVREVITSRLIRSKGSTADDDAWWPFEPSGVGDRASAADSPYVTYQITGTGFLRHMVRNIVGTLVDIGRGRRTPEDVAAILASRDRAQASATAPPQGLWLWHVDY